MRKFRVTAVLIAVVLSTLSTPAFGFATPKPNGACSTASDFGIASGQMMTCKEINSKLVWVLNNNVLAGGLCSAWLPGDTRTWAELQLSIGGKWVTQVYPIAFTPGPPCDRTKINSSIPWISLPTKIADGTKYRWIKGTSGKDGHGGRAFGTGSADPVFIYTAKAMQARYFKAYTAIVPPIEGPHVYAARIAALSPVPTTVQSSAPTPTSTAVATPATGKSNQPVLEPMPISIPVKESTDSKEITFKNVLQRASDVPTFAWKKINNLVKQDGNPTINIKILIGPNTTYPANVGSVIEQSARLNYGFNLPKNISVIFFSFEDRQWAKTQLRSEISSFLPYVNGFVDGNCDSSSCNGANASLLDGETGVMAFGISPNNLRDPYIISGAVVSHEFTHLAQGAQWSANYAKVSDVPNGALAQTAPCWLIEGEANLKGIATVSPAIDSYNAVRNQQAAGHPSHTFLDYSSSAIKNYLFNQIPNKCRIEGDEYNLGYSIGMLAVEALTAIAGPQPVLALTHEQALGVDFSTAFTRVYGISWDEASTTLAQLIASEFATHPPGKY